MATAWVDNIPFKVVIQKLYQFYIEVLLLKLYEEFNYCSHYYPNMDIEKFLIEVQKRDLISNSTYREGSKKLKEWGINNKQIKRWTKLYSYKINPSYTWQILTSLALLVLVSTVKKSIINHW